MTRSERLQRLYGLYGIADAEVSRDPAKLAHQMLSGGCRIIQLRCKKLQPSEIARLGSEILADCRRFGALLIINDHPEIAASIGADGVHLGQKDGEIAQARKILGEEALIGRSTNQVLQVVSAAMEADYIAFGPVFCTSNAGRPKRVRGLEGLRQARGFVPAHRPLVAIGGINEERLESVVAAGADAWAAIGAIALDRDPVAATRRLSRPHSSTTAGVLKKLTDRT